MFPSNLIHPGEYIKDEILSRGITQRQLAEKIGMQPSILNEIINGKRSVNIEFALLLEAALGIDADIWIRLQNLYNKQKARMNPDFMSRLSKVTRIDSVL
ncbi:MAG: HigA family addiction module antidote protein [Muribaculaceae bacterium]|nr:HigA family addiction module antidote protein [Muribaculaceae bacterium]